MFINPRDFFLGEARVLYYQVNVTLERGGHMTHYLGSVLFLYL